MKLRYFFGDVRVHDEDDVPISMPFFAARNGRYLGLFLVGIDYAERPPRALYRSLLSLGRGSEGISIEIFMGIERALLVLLGQKPPFIKFVFVDDMQISDTEKPL